MKTPESPENKRALRLSSFALGLAATLGLSIQHLRDDASTQEQIQALDTTIKHFTGQLQLTQFSGARDEYFHGHVPDPEELKSKIDKLTEERQKLAQNL